ncbi:MAG: GNAT family N-acetyltransferase [Oscillospiraceae bacterium]|nr:GNAT family N-acetyltransferase [Oscillospiraceae bacterium]MCR5306512.1 GNAT family N-acetyltransferase [Oscillospiraceae bacterium]
MSEIRRALPADIPGIIRLLYQVDMVHHRGRPDIFRGPAAKYGEAELNSILADDRTPVFVWLDDSGTVRGHAFCILQQHLHHPVLTDIRTLYIDDICVDETCRRQHIGEQLFRTVTDFARASGCYNVTLNVWACNPDAQAFYEKCGMKPQKIGMETIL